MRWLAFAIIFLFACSLSSCEEIDDVENDYVDEPAPADMQADPPADTEPVENTSDAVPRLEDSSCLNDYADLEIEMDCGTLVVWENRDKAAGTLVQLPVVFLYSNAEDFAPDPLIFLSGGPGEAGIDPESWLALPFLGDRDMILFDQRGTGNATPSLNCPELDETDDEYGAAAVCMDRLLDEGADLTMYNSAASAADVRDLVTVLGYDQYNLIGISYGTRLALTVMRDYPEGLRSVILDSVYPPHADGFGEKVIHGWSAMQLLFAACAADPACDNAYPELEAIFLETIEMLDQLPVDLEGGTLFGADLVDGIFQALYNYDQIPYIPLVIYDTYNGYYDTFLDLQDYALPYNRLLQDDEADTSSEGSYYSVECHEEAPFARDDAVASLASGIPEPVREALLNTVSAGYL